MHRPDHVQLKLRCLKCRLHFIILTENPKAHDRRSIICPECGQKEGKYMMWREDSDLPIFRFVPRDSKEST